MLGGIVITAIICFTLILIAVIEKDDFKITKRADVDGLIAEAKELKDCIKTGFNERAYELAQNIEDELVSMAIKKN